MKFAASSLIVAVSLGLASCATAPPSQLASLDARKAAAQEKAEQERIKDRERRDQSNIPVADRRGNLDYRPNGSPLP